MATSVEELRKIRPFADLEDEDLKWVIDQSREIVLKPGETLIRQGSPADTMFIFIEGAAQARDDTAGIESPVFPMEAGDVTGMLPFSRMKTFTISSRATEPSRILGFPAAKFPEMLHRVPRLGERLVGIMADRIREVTRMQQQRDKLAALGKLSAGLAHELNNPAAAAKRSATTIRQSLEKIRAADKLACLPVHKKLMLLDFEDVLRKRRCAEEAPPAHSMENDNDEEETIATWLEQNAVSDAWQLAPVLASACVTIDELARIREITEAQISPALHRFVGLLELENVLSELDASTSRISDLVRAIKEYSYMDQSPIQEIDIPRSLDTTITILTHKLKRGIVVKRDYAADVPKVKSYGSELNQVWTNLIDNAADAMKDGGELRVRVALEDGCVLVEIGDTGAGIPPEVQPHIFEPFFTTKGIGDGTGLGLDSVYRIIRKLHGSITFDSVPGNTRFQVRLPIEVTPP